jgi:methyl-accepting chemotaxis protein
MFQKMSLSQKLYSGFATVLFITAGLGVFSWYEIRVIEGHSTRITQDCLPGVYNIGQAESNLRRMMQEGGRALLSEDPAYREKAVEKLIESKKNLDEIFTAYEGTITTDKDRNLYADLRDPRAKFHNYFDSEIIPLIRQGKIPEAKHLYFGDLETQYNGYRSALLVLVDFNKAAADEVGLQITSSVNSAVTGILMVLAMAIAIGSAIGFIIVNSVLLKTRY